MTTKAAQKARGITIMKEGKSVRVELAPGVDVGTLDGRLWFSDGMREVVVGPLTPEQAEKLGEDLRYERLAEG